MHFLTPSALLMGRDIIGPGIKEVETAEGGNSWNFRTKPIILDFRF